MNDKSSLYIAIVILLSLTCLVIISLIYSIHLERKRKKSPNNKNTQPANDLIQAHNKFLENENIPQQPNSAIYEPTIDRNAYQKKLLLTKNEWFEWKKLKTICDKQNLLICPKVRLLDLIEPQNGEGFMSRLGKIQSKHVDFVICDKKLYVIGIIELDDNSHYKRDRVERDSFVDSILTSVGYKVHRTRAITENTLSFLYENEK